MTVKRKIRIAAGILAMYVMSLPIALTFHSQTHSKQDVQIDQSDVTDIILEDSSDCQICSFYFDQQLYVESSHDFQFEHLSYYFHLSPTETPSLVSQDQLCLRGPPLV